MTATTTTTTTMTETLPTLPEGASLFVRLPLAKRCLDALKDDPGHTHYGPLLNACLDTETYGALARAWRQTPEGARLLDERPTLQGRELDLAALAALPDGTLGRAFVDYFRRNGIEPFVTAFPIRSDVDYLSKRYRETHDLFHVVTGYGTDELGEMELQAFVRGNLGLQQTLMIVAYGGWRRLRLEGVVSLGDYLGRLRAAWWRGRRSRELLSVPWETLWARPLAEVSALLVAPV